MSTLRQFCPQCGRALELPATAVGRQAKCPACEATFTVVAPNTALPTDASESNSDFGSLAQGSVSNQSSMGGSFRSAPPDPYAPSYSPSPVTRVENVEIVDRVIEEVFGPSWSIFTERWSPLILSFLIVGVASFVLIGAPFLAIALLAQQIGEDLAALIMVALFPILLIAGVFAWVGLTRVSLAVARNQPTPLSELLPPMNLVWRMLLVWFLLMALAIIPSLLVAGLLGGLAFAIGGEQALAVSFFGIAGILTIVGVIAQIFLWPIPYVVCDDKSTALGSLKIAFAISMQNKLTSFFLYLISIVLSMVGSSVCYVGLIVTQPLTLLIFAVAYLLMTNQQIANPREIQPQYPEQPRAF